LLSLRLNFFSSKLPLFYFCENITMKNSLLHHFIFVFILFFVAGCNPLAAKKTQPPAVVPQPVAVTTLKVKAEDIPVQYEFVGQVAGSIEVDVRSRITGIIEQRHYMEGSHVKAGELLFSLDAAPFQAEYEQSLAAIEIAKAQKVTAEAQLNQARRELKRVTPLAQKQMVSQNQLDDAASAVDIAVAQKAVSEAAIKAAQANLLTAAINLDYTRIKASIDGIAGRALFNRGALVQAGSDSLLTRLVQTNPVHVNFGIPENDHIRMRREVASGLLVLPESGFTVDLLDDEGKSYGRSGALDFQDYKVDNNTGNFAMRALIQNDKGILSPGQFVRVRLKGAVRKNAIALPQRSLLDNPEGKYVYVASAGEKGMQVALQKNIKPGEWVDLDAQRKNYWIIDDGLVVGDEVIVDGVARIFFPGMPVTTAAPAPAQQ
jgi:membrane fusion protein (multidrug efflux system)